MIPTILHVSINPAGLVHRGDAKFVWLVGCEGERSEPNGGTRQNGLVCRIQDKLDSDKFGNEAGDQIGGLIKP